MYVVIYIYMYKLVSVHGYVSNNPTGKRKLVEKILQKQCYDQNLTSRKRIRLMPIVLEN